jgi:MoxR-like ATPase
VRYGASVRAAQTIVLAAKVTALMAGRAHVAFEDLRAAAKPALRHRLVLNFEGEAEGVGTDMIVDQVLAELPEMPAEVAGLDGA